MKAKIGWSIENRSNYGSVAVHNRAIPQDLLMAAFQLEINILDELDQNKQQLSREQLIVQLKRAGWNVDSHLLAADEFTFDENN